MTRLVILLLLIGCTQAPPPRSPARAYDPTPDLIEAQLLIVDGDLETAILILETLVEENGESWQGDDARELLKGLPPLER